MKTDELRKGDLVLVRWTDASDSKATLEEHSTSPEATCKDWGVFLGLSGTRRRFVLIGKDVVEGHREWGATRIPAELVDEVRLLLPREQVVAAIGEAETLDRRIRLRKQRRGEARDVRVS